MNERFIDRGLSRLEFTRRVFEEAENPTVSLLECVESPPIAEGVYPIAPEDLNAEQEGNRSPGEREAGGSAPRVAPQGSES